MRRYFRLMDNGRNLGANAAAKIEVPEEEIHLSVEESARLELLKSHQNFAEAADRIIKNNQYIEGNPSELMDFIKKAFFNTYPSYSFYGARLPVADTITDSRVNQNEIDRVLFIVSNIYEEYYRKDHCLYILIESLLKSSITGNYSHDELGSLTSDQKYEMLEDFAVRNGGEGVAELASMLFANQELLSHIPRSTAMSLAAAYSRLGKDAFEATVSSALKAALTDSDVKTPHARQGNVIGYGDKLPNAAPEIYQGLRGPETPPAFVQRVYGPWLGHGLDRGHIRQLDPTLYQAIINWARRNEWPAEVDLPTRAENNSRLIEAVERDGPAALSIQGPHSLKALASLESARRRRTSGRE